MKLQDIHTANIKYKPLTIITQIRSKCVVMPKYRLCLAFVLKVHGLSKRSAQ